MSWEWEPYFLEGLFKLSGAYAAEDQVPVVHSYDLVVKYKDGTKKTETVLDGYRKRKNARRAAQKAAKNRENGSEADEIENVSYKFRNVYIQDWV